MLKNASSKFVELNARQVHYLEWGAADAPLIVMVHGWMDVASSFQFLVDALTQSWRVVAPDLRGFGLTEWGRESATGYWFNDYLADLDALIDHVSPSAPVSLVGHSLGGNIVCMYAGVRPTRVQTLISLDGFGVPEGKVEQAPEKIEKWLDSVRKGAALSPYDDLAGVARRLQKNNPRLSAERAKFLAPHWAEQMADGRYALRADPAHKLPFPTVYRLEESIAVWSRIACPTMWVGAAESQIVEWLGYGRDDPREFGPNDKHSAEFSRRLAAFRDIRFEIIKDAGHMLHHDQPEAVARLVEQFLAHQRIG